MRVRDYPLNLNRRCDLKLVRQLGFGSKRTLVGRDRLTWRKDGVRLLLFHGSHQKPLAIVGPDHKYPVLYRIRYPDGHLSDMVNLARAKDAACRFALRSLNSPPQETPLKGSQARKKAEAV
jgi:hypothetical protein